MDIVESEEGWHTRHLQRACHGGHLANAKASYHRCFVLVRGWQVISRDSDAGKPSACCSAPRGQFPLTTDFCASGVHASQCPARPGSDHCRYLGKPATPALAAGLASKECPGNPKEELPRAGGVDRHGIHRLRRSVHWGGRTSANGPASWCASSSPPSRGGSGSRKWALAASASAPAGALRGKIGGRGCMAASQESAFQGRWRQAGRGTPG